MAGQTLDLTEVVNGPADAIAIAGAGPDYGVVVTVAESAWTWTNGPVSGDGGDLLRMTPGDIAVNDYTWRVGMPRATWTDVPFTPETSVQLSSRTYGAQIYYTLDGSTATEGSTPSPGSINAPYDSPLSAIAALSGFPNSLPLATFLPSVTHVAPLSLSPPPGSSFRPPTRDRHDHDARSDRLLHGGWLWRRMRTPRRSPQRRQDRSGGDEHAPRLRHGARPRALTDGCRPLRDRWIHAGDLSRGRELQLGNPGLGGRKRRRNDLLHSRR